MSRRCWTQRKLSQERLVSERERLENEQEMQDTVEIEPREAGQ